MLHCDIQAPVKTLFQRQMMISALVLVLALSANSAAFADAKAPAAAPKAAVEAPAEDDPETGQETGLPVPRFATLRYEEVNVRTGPGNRYPIRWVYKRKNVPVEITEEFDQWRKVKDVEGDEGWAHKSQLSGMRNAVFTEDAMLKRAPEEAASAMLKVRKGVIGQLLECQKVWCEVQVDSYKAWVQKNRIWGVYRREEFEE